MSMNIIAGYRGEAHITSQQLRNKNIGIFGDDACILAVGSEMAATVISANEVDIADGILVAEGCTAEIMRGTVEAMAIDNGTQGMLRTDLIVARYTKNSGTGVEDMQLAVIKGTPAASDPATPSHTTGSIAAGDTLVDFPLYKVSLNGISIESVTRLVRYAELASKSVVDALSATVSELVTKVGSSTMGTVAQTVTGAINELLASVTNALTRISPLEAKTGGIAGTRQFNVAGGGRTYIPLSPTSTYVVIINGYSTNNNHRGMYLIGASASNALGIKAISTAADAELVDSGTIGGTAGVLRIINNGSIAMRVTIITTTGTPA